MNITHLNVLQRALDASALRQQTISNNLANADTPNYKPKRVVFEEALRDAMSSRSKFQGIRTHEKHIPIGRPAGIPDPRFVQDQSILHNDGNGVDVDYEMTELARNSLWYHSLSQQITHEFNLLKTAIDSRR